MRSKIRAYRYLVVFRFLIPLPNSRYSAYHHFLRKFWCTFSSWEVSKEGIVVLFPLQSGSKPLKHVRNCLAIHCVVCGVHNLNYFQVVCVCELIFGKASRRVMYGLGCANLRFEAEIAVKRQGPPAHPIYC